ncbi:spore coat protein, partial [Cohnella sp. GbtcB17]|uniref:spore coat protein n=1 Tax=Cohnella sp. GbtcB17 TaxID=2824762 RepID=UPI001C310854
RAAPTLELRSRAYVITDFFVAHLLLFVKTVVRNYAIPITETAPPARRDTIVKQLDYAIPLHY